MNYQIPFNSFLKVGTLMLNKKPKKLVYFPQDVFTNIMGFCGETQKDRYNKVVKQLNQLVQDSHEYIEKYGDLEIAEYLPCGGNWLHFNEYKNNRNIISSGGTLKYCSEINECGSIFMLMLWNRDWYGWLDYDYYCEGGGENGINLSNLMENPYGIYPRSHQNGFN